MEFRKVMAEKLSPEEEARDLLHKVGSLPRVGPEYSYAGVRKRILTNLSELVQQGSFSQAVERYRQEVFDLADQVAISVIDNAWDALNVIPENHSLERKVQLEEALARALWDAQHGDPFAAVTVAGRVRVQALQIADGPPAGKRNGHATLSAKQRGQTGRVKNRRGKPPNKRGRHRR